jgi:hypothetical protein
MSIEGCGGRKAQSSIVRPKVDNRTYADNFYRVIFDKLSLMNLIEGILAPPLKFEMTSHQSSTN